MKLTSNNGLCVHCEDRADCPMPSMLRSHHQNVKNYGEFYKDVRPDLDEEFIDEPEIKNGEVIWCPMYFCDSPIGDK